MLKCFAWGLIFLYIYWSHGMHDSQWLVAPHGWARRCDVLRLLPGLVRAILAEALGLSASALGGVQVVLTGACDTATDQPAGVHRGQGLGIEPCWLYWTGL